MTVPSDRSLKEKTKMKFLHRFCSEEVMTMLERMDTFPDEFVDSNKWDDFLPMGFYNKRFNFAEKRVIDKRYEKLKKEYHPRRARQAIIETLMEKDKKEVTRPSTLLTTKAVTQQALDLLNQQLADKYSYENIIKGNHNA
jgi:hypothetical protein